jgi:hypothetical protein
VVRPSVGVTAPAGGRLCLGPKRSRAFQIYCDSTTSTEPPISGRSGQGDPAATDEEEGKFGIARSRRRNQQEHAVADRARRRQPVVVDGRGHREGAWRLGRKAGATCRRRGVRRRRSGLILRPGCDHDAPERLGIARKAPERRSRARPTIWLCARQNSAPRGTSRSAPDWIRTSDLRFRRPTLYPAELRAHALRVATPRGREQGLRDSRGRAARRSLSRGGPLPPSGRQCGRRRPRCRSSRRRWRR